MTEQKTTNAALPAQRPLRVMLGVDTFTPDINGAARFSERLAAGLVERGHEVHIVAPAANSTDTGAIYEIVEGQRMLVHRLPSVRFKPHEWLRFVWPWVCRVATRKLVREIQPDVIHIQSHLMIGRMLTKAVKNNGNVRKIATNHIMPENIVDLANMPRWVRALVVKWGWHDAYSVLRHMDAITTPTRRAADFLERYTPVRNVYPISCGIDASQYTPDLTPRAQRRVVFVGRMTQEKHVDVIVRALALQDADVQLDLVGPGDQVPQLRDLAQQLGVADRVTFHGRVSDAQLRAALTGASVFAIASVAELQSIATMEAMASGLPILAANAMALPHLVDEGVNGYLFEPGNHEQLGAQLRQILELPHEDFVAMQRASLEGVKAHDINTTLDTFERLYRGE